MAQYRTVKFRIAEAYVNQFGLIFPTCTALPWEECRRSVYDPVV